MTKLINQFLYFLAIVENAFLLPHISQVTCRQVKDVGCASQKVLKATQKRTVGFDIKEFIQAGKCLAVRHVLIKQQFMFMKPFRHGVQLPTGKYEKTNLCYSHEG